MAVEMDWVAVGKGWVAVGKGWVAVGKGWVAMETAWVAVGMGIGEEEVEKLGPRWYEHEDPQERRRKR